MLKLNGHEKNYYFSSRLFGMIEQKKICDKCNYYFSHLYNYINFFFVCVYLSYKI